MATTPGTARLPARSGSLGSPNDAGAKHGKGHLRLVGDFLPGKTGIHIRLHGLVGFRADNFSDRTTDDLLWQSAQICGKGSVDEEAPFLSIQVGDECRGMFGNGQHRVDGIGNGAASLMVLTVAFLGMYGSF